MYLDVLVIFKHYCLQYISLIWLQWHHCLPLCLCELSIVWKGWWNEHLVIWTPVWTLSRQPTCLLAPGGPLAPYGLISLAILSPSHPQRLGAVLAHPTGAAPSQNCISSCIIHWHLIFCSSCSLFVILTSSLPHYFYFWVDCPPGL